VGVACPKGALNENQKRWGSHVPRVLSNIAQRNKSFCVCWCFLVLCNISQIATGVPYSESLRTNAQIAPILIKIGCDLTCFGPVQSFDVLILKKRKVGVACPQGAQKNAKNGGGRMSLGCSQTLNLAPSPRTFL
jgi:hypothetical protein